MTAHSTPRLVVTYGGDGCGHRIADGQRFCERCGRAVDHGVRRIAFGPTAVHGKRIPDAITGIIGRYVLLGLLGRGGMGRVYRGLQTQSGQIFALKMIASGRDARRAAVLFEQEARTQSAIVHPNIVRVFEVVRERGRLALVSEFVDGQSLDHLFDARTQPFSIRDTLWFWQGMCRGLAVAHRHRYVHADIKPGNFLLARSRRGHQEIKLTDFGISRDRAGHLRGAKSTAGTPGYMSPEQIEGRRLTYASDLYSLACVVYEMLAGYPVFPWDEAEKMNQRHLSEPPTPLRRVRSGVDPALSALVQRLLSKAPEARAFNNARELLDILERPA